jgi:raffinose/stachyose/melibiose transport system substrate-binding protein
LRGGKVKKVIIFILAVVLAVTIGLVGTSCKAGAAAETTAAGTTAAAVTTAAATTQAAETTAAQSTASPGSITLRFTDFQGGNDAILKSYTQMKDIFIKAHPEVKDIEYTQYTVTTYNEFLKPAISGGTAPDLFAVYPGPDVAEVVESGALRNLKPDIDDEWKSWLGPAYNFKGMAYKDGIYVVAQDVWTECVWYHKDMLKEIGWEIPASTAAFTPEEYAKMVAPAKAKGYDVMSAGFVETWCYFDAFFNFVHQQQSADVPDMVEDAFAGKISWQQPIFKNAMEVFVKLNDAGVWPKDALSMDYQVQAFGGWLEKKSIFLWAQGDWFAGSMKPEENNKDNPNIGITQYPLVSADGEAAFNKNFGTDIGVYAKGPNQDLAVQWIRLTNSPEAAKIFMSNGVNPASGVNLNDLPEITNPVLEECIKLYNSPGKYSEVYYFYPDGVKALGDGIGNVVLGVDTIDNVLKSLDEVSGFKG